MSSAHSVSAHIQTPAVSCASIQTAARHRIRMILGLWGSRDSQPLEQIRNISITQKLIPATRIDRIISAEPRRI